MTGPLLTSDIAARFAAIALGHVERAYPHKLDHVMAGPDDARTPADLHPMFHGSFDWHSSVHATWMLARLLRSWPDMPAASAIRASFERRFQPAKVATECRYMERPTARGFERPYGWAWLLKLAAELRDAETPAWSEALAPLTRIVAERYSSFLPLATYPVRAGTHGSTAFSLRLAADYADAADAGLATLLRQTACRWYGADVACPAWGEPSGDDFLSPALVEAECIRRLVPADAFRAWFDAFLPALADSRPAVLFQPATVSDRSDGKTAHLDGLNLSRAWCWRALAKTLPDHDARGGVMRAAADRHLAAGLPHVAGDYMGEHWLASFAVLALDA